MKSIVRKDSGKGWKAYTRKLVKKTRLKHLTHAELRQFDKKRAGKNFPNDDWESLCDPAARITGMKTGTSG